VENLQHPHVKFVPEALKSIGTISVQLGYIANISELSAIDTDEADEVLEDVEKIHNRVSESSMRGELQSHYMGFDFLITTSCE
jgi:hypothetical protein